MIYFKVLLINFFKNKSGFLKKSLRFGVLLIYLFIVFLMIKYVYFFDFMKNNKSVVPYLGRDLILPFDFQQTKKTFKVPILAYHHIKKTSPTDNATEKILSVSPDDFEKQLKFLRFWGYNSISLLDLFEAFYYDKKLPPRPIVITFDDGYKDFKTEAIPLLEKYGFSATVFVITEKIGQKNYLSWEDIKELPQKGIEVAAHTKTHPHLNLLSVEKIDEEVIASKEILENELGFKVHFFSYPYGIYNDQIIERLKKAGYLGAVTLKYNINQYSNKPFELNRVEIRGDKDNLLRFVAKIWGINYKKWFSKF